MTIGHLQEMLFSKVAALNGKIQDATPFCHENIKTMADLLKANGFQEFGNERLIDGVTGLMHEANLFICPIYYQRLRHMVDDKIHVRDNTGPRSVLTRQPPAGRGNNGGHRVGEMESAAIISSGASEIQKCLWDQSDKTKWSICGQCHTYNPYKPKNDTCVNCGHVGKIKHLTCPYSFKLVRQELMQVGILIKDKIDWNNQVRPD
tara:strand:+ start:1434 stop:2048 length:615 start_codon:yes stop_codon:yes gene_type:complete